MTNENEPDPIERMAESHYLAAQAEVEVPSIPWSELTSRKRSRMCRVMLTAVRELGEMIIRQPHIGAVIGARCIKRVIEEHEKRAKDMSN